MAKSNILNVLLRFRVGVGLGVNCDNNDINDYRARIDRIAGVVCRETRILHGGEAPLSVKCAATQSYYLSQL